MATLTVNTTLADGAVTNTKLADMAQGTVKGRAAGAGTGDPQDLTPDQASAILDTATDPFVRTSNLPADTGITQLTGDVTAGPGSGSQTATIADNAVTYAKMQDMPSNHLIGRHTAGAGDPQNINIDGGLELHGASIRRSALTGDVTASAGDDSTTIANDAVTNAKLANMATTTIKGRVSAGTGDPEDLSASQARTVLGLGTAALVNTGTGSEDVPTIANADARYARLSSPTFLAYNGGNQVTTSVSLADVHASANFTINETGFYEFQFYITYNAALTTTGAVFSVNGTATQDYVVGLISYDSLTADRSSYQFSGYDGLIASISSRFATGNTAILYGKANLTGTGNLRLRFATEVAGSAITVTAVIGYIRKLN